MRWGSHTFSSSKMSPQKSARYMCQDVAEITNNWQEKDIYHSEKKSVPCQQLQK